MMLPDTLNGSAAKGPIRFFLSTPLYFATTFLSLTVLLLLIFSGDGYNEFSQDDILLFPIIALFFSLMTGPIRCSFWALSFCIQVRWLASEESSGGQIRLMTEEDVTVKKSRAARIGDILLSWNAWVATTLVAALAVLIWRFVQNAKSTALLPQAGWGAALLGVACIVHMSLAVPGYGDRRFMLLCYPFKEEYEFSDEEQVGA